MTRYEALANRLAAEIRYGRIEIGARLPSIRQLIAQHHVSQSTVFRAYYLLEEWGLIRAQERSGYLVALGAAIELKIASKPVAPTFSEKVDISELVFSVLDATKHPNLVPLGSAFPSPLLCRCSGLRSPWGTLPVSSAPGAPSLTCRRVTNSYGDKSRSAISALAFHNRLKKLL